MPLPVFYLTGWQAIGFRKPPRLFTWTITILTTMKAQGFERKFADAFHTVEMNKSYLEKL